MKPVVIALGLGALIAGGVLLVGRMTETDCTVMRRGGAYRFIVLQDSVSEGDLGMLGFASVVMVETTPAADGTRAWEVQAIWVGEDGYEFCPPVNGMGAPVFLRMVTERQSTPDVPMQGPSQTTSQSGFFINFPAQGLVNLNE